MNGGAPDATAVFTFHSDYCNTQGYWMSPETQFQGFFSWRNEEITYSNSELLQHAEKPGTNREMCWETEVFI